MEAELGGAKSLVLLLKALTSTGTKSYLKVKAGQVSNSL